MVAVNDCTVQENELFVSDVHGEYESFAYLLRSGCGAVKRRIDEVFEASLSEEERQSLATLVAYPQKKMDLMLQGISDADGWFLQTCGQLAALCSSFARLHGEGILNDSLPQEYRAQILELSAMDPEDAQNRAVQMARSFAEQAESRTFALALCQTIQRLAAGRVHMVGDVFDRGPAPDLVMDEMLGYPMLDIQWGNHDMLWMGASLGQRGCVANVVRICARYGNLDVLRDTYGIDLQPLVDFAFDAYGDDPCAAFGLKGSPNISEEEQLMNVKVQKAMAFIQFKVEAQLIAENPSFGLEARNLLHRIDFEAGTVELDGVVHELTDKVFPTIDPADPYRMTPEEEAVMAHLEQAFLGCERLQRHIALFLEKGSLYKICGDTLAYHACVPLNADGSFKETTIFGQTLSGRSLCDAVDGYVRDAFTATDPETRKRGLDFLWYLWLGEGSPLFAKSKMATFELYLITDKAARKEVKNPYYSLLEDEQVLAGIFREFGMDPATSRIVCGHTPVKVKDGEDPVKCGGKALIIDGGMSRAYQSTTGVAGFALVKDERGVNLATLEPFCGEQAAIEGDLGLGMTWREL